MNGRPKDAQSAKTREERLAAKLRENLHRRKAQARALTVDSEDAEPDQRADPAIGDDCESDRLSKSSPES
nr:hypothetical protein [Novosphingobium sp. PhB165]